jgi:hypothetical protein
MQVTKDRLDFHDSYTKKPLVLPGISHSLVVILYDRVKLSRKIMDLACRKIGTKRSHRVISPPVYSRPRLPDVTISGSPWAKKESQVERASMPGFS